MANILSSEKRTQIVRCLVEGMSIRGTSRITGCCKEAITNLLCALGDACLAYQDKALRELTCKRVQADEIWAFCGCKEGHLKPEEKGRGRGDVWTWTALDPDTKLCICWHVGLREQTDAILFMHNLASRLANRVQLSTDGFIGYPSAVESAFGSDVDYGQVIKVFGATGEGSRMEARYSPARCTEIRYNSIVGEPDSDQISTSNNERNNLTMRMQIRRFTRLTNAFSKKMENHAHAVNLHMMNYNFCRIHQTLRCTPAMAAGVANRVWEISDVVALLDAP